MADLTRRSVLASAAAALWCLPRPDRAGQPDGGNARFLIEPTPDGGQRPFFASGFIDHDPALPYVHCPSICELPDGRLVCAWYAGSRETARDVAVWLADAGPVGNTETIPWGRPRMVIDRDRAIEQLGRFVDKVGNSVVFADAEGRLWLVYVTIAIGGWSGSCLNACSSTDGGATWTRSRRLCLSPFFNVSELVRAAPVRLDSGGIVLPVYHECIGKFPELLWLEPRGDRLKAVKSRLAGGRSLLQPAIVPLDGRRAIAYLRDHSPARRLVVQRSDDAGREWTPPEATSLPNPDASVAAIRLSSGATLLAFNDSAVGRESLGLAVSADGIGGWRRIARLDREAGQKFAYPYLIRDQKGLVHLVYTWKMRRIRHVAMNEAWILGQTAEPIA
jgi:predicted neuraminidase